MSVYELNGYDDTLSVEDARGSDLAAMSKGTHYNYVSQRWVDGHDHAHCVSRDESQPLMFCGADVVSCLGVK